MNDEDRAALAGAIRRNVAGFFAKAMTEPRTHPPLTVAVTPEQLAGMVALRYSDGASHEDVTAWLEEATAGRFREVLWEIECHTAESSVFKRWMLAPKMITMTLELGPEAPHG